jgi:prepilin-type N-terminal cleavage/methylation domain-containing protein
MKNKKGFTLVEVIISIAALGIICAVLLRLFVVAGSTNSKAGDMQSAEIAVTSAVETLAGADTLQGGLLALGVNCPDNITDECFSFSSGGFDITVNVESKGDYPGVLYDIEVKAMNGDSVLASTETAKYYKERQR